MAPRDIPGRAARSQAGRRRPRWARGRAGRRIAADERGQSIVELALVSPVLLVVLLLAVDFGRLFFTYIAVNNAAREATSYAAAHAADVSFDLTTYRDGVAAAGLQETNAQSQGGTGSLIVSHPTCFDPSTMAELDCHAASNYAGGTGNRVRVSVAQPFTFLTPLIGDAFGGAVTLSASATAPVLNPPDATVLAGPTLPPLPTPTPTATPTATPTLPPDATPAPTPEPTPEPTPPTCQVPDFFNTYFHDPSAVHTWHDVAHFTGTLTDESDGKRIKKQTLTAGTWVLCSSDMTVDDK